MPEVPIMEQFREAFRHLPTAISSLVRVNEPLCNHTTLRVGGPASLYYEARCADDLAAINVAAQQSGIPHFILGDGSNVCVSDGGIDGLVIRNRAAECTIGTTTTAGTGFNFMRLFVQTMQHGLSGMEFAVGIPGTLGGALVSNAGAYRANICDLVECVEVVEKGRRRWVGPEWMEFSYRDSRLRRDLARPAALIRVKLVLKTGSKTDIRLKAREIQMQRILKQPWEPSAGSFFKNVNSRVLAEKLPELPASMREAGVVPAAYLSQACGCKGLRIGGAGISHKHANFVVNCGGATATEIRAVAETLKKRVRDRFGVLLEEEVMYLGKWPSA